MCQSCFECSGKIKTLVASTDHSSSSLSLLLQLTRCLAERSVMAVSLPFSLSPTTAGRERNLYRFGRRISKPRVLISVRMVAEKSLLARSLAVTLAALWCHATIAPARKTSRWRPTCQAAETLACLPHHVMATVLGLVMCVEASRVAIVQGCVLGRAAVPAVFWSPAMTSRICSRGFGPTAEAFNPVEKSPSGAFRSLKWNRRGPASRIVKTFVLTKVMQWLFRLWCFQSSCFFI